MDKSNFKTGLLRLVVLIILFLPVSGRSAPPIEGITFAVNPGRIYLPVDVAARNLGWQVEYDDDSKLLKLNGKTLKYRSLRQIIGGARLVNLANLASAGAILGEKQENGQVTVKSESRMITVLPGNQRVIVDLAKQNLKAWQGKYLVLDCHISSGRGGCTPAGKFTAGPYKARRHYSSLFNTAPMPYSVQFSGHFFFHGFSSVPDYPASHGCIRMHLDRGNPARFLYDWVNVGTPVQIVKGKKNK